MQVLLTLYHGLHVQLIVPTSSSLLPASNFSSLLATFEYSSKNSPPAASGYLLKDRPAVERAFWVTFIFGSISRSKGCKDKILRSESKKPLPPPNDIVLGMCCIILHALECTSILEINVMFTTIHERLV